MLFHGWGRLPVAEILDIGSDVDRTHRINRGHAAGLQPSAERADRPHVGAAGVRVADLGGEEFEEAVGRAITGTDTRAGARDELGATRVTIVTSHETANLGLWQRLCTHHHVAVKGIQGDGSSFPRVTSQLVDEEREGSRSLRHKCNRICRQ